MADNKLSIALIFGGRSGEYEVSIASARSVAAEFDDARYELVPVRIGKDGIWRVDYRILSGGGRGRKGGRRLLPSCPGDNHLRDYGGQPMERIDVAFPVMHGTFGEDGCIQGLLEMTGIPFVGSGVLGSAVGMDKAVQKVLLREADIPVVDFTAFRRIDWENDAESLRRKVMYGLGFPCFVKPANLGSSVGITKAHDSKEFEVGVTEALRYDEKVIVERSVEGAREIECAVLGNLEPEASVLGEVLPSNEFYDYSAKYISGKSELVIPAELPEKLSVRLREAAIQAFRILEAEGLARVDFLMDPEGRCYLNEINTMPGFTRYSMYPKLWAETGVEFPRLLDRLVQLAVERSGRKSALKRDFTA